MVLRCLTLTRKRCTLPVPSQLAILLSTVTTQQKLSGTVCHHVTLRRQSGHHTRFAPIGGMSQPQNPGRPNPLHKSVFVSEDAPVYDVPISVIHRPLQSYIDENKVHPPESSLLLEPTMMYVGACHANNCRRGFQVEEFVANMQKGDNFTSVEVLWVQKGKDDYYFSFGGCHRWQAHKRLKRSTIKAKLIKTTPKSRAVYLGRHPFQ